MEKVAGGRTRRSISLNSKREEEETLAARSGLGGLISKANAGTEQGSPGVNTGTGNA
jgi:hypothetical protein